MLLEGDGVKLPVHNGWEDGNGRPRRSTSPRPWCGDSAGDGKAMRSQTNGDSLGSVPGTSFGLHRISQAVVRLFLKLRVSDSGSS
ncbi:hypothetical protein H6P81_001218 [Aristolochia fimbriata]|uniref:Uncharacterized protein n=1 Tax=Aristolochia fimbriata TaxID=158543 RepID=A0AAV7F696_ARIFI|nr:hypothetical protein H6P81_001218 [Aristolochia fimbriata]